MHDIPPILNDPNADTSSAEMCWGVRNCLSALSS